MQAFAKSWHRLRRLSLASAHCIVSPVPYFFSHSSLLIAAAHIQIGACRGLLRGE
jgi:hypothetical protein